MVALNELYVALDDMTVFFDELAMTTNNKLDAVSENDIEKLEQCMKDEQAATMKLRSMDYKREQLLKKLGFESYTLKDIIKEVSDENDKNKLSNYYDKIQNKIDKIQDANKCAGEYIDIHLHYIDEMVDLYSGKKAEAISYDKKGEKDEDDGKKNKFTSKKV